jgi:predicted glycoside hydrolase/deacetylase ChbG (UPF0249 family)
MINTPFAARAVRFWRHAGRPMDLGWHPNLTLDAPILPPSQVPSLVTPAGEFHPLRSFVFRCFTGRIRRDEVAAELAAQHHRYCEMVGEPPRLVNSHQHVAVFEPARSALLEVLSRQSPRPYLRRVVEPANTLTAVPGARAKRCFLTLFGRASARAAERAGFPGCDALLGVTAPRCVFDDRFYTRWIEAAPGSAIELMVHPGHCDDSLAGRDCPPGIGVARRVREWELIERPEFAESLRRAGFVVARAEHFRTPPTPTARAA